MARLERYYVIDINIRYANFKYLIDKRFKNKKSSNNTFESRKKKTKKWKKDSLIQTRLILTYYYEYELITL